MLVQGGKLDCAAKFGTMREVPIARRSANMNRIPLRFVAFALIFIAGGCAANTMDQLLRDFSAAATDVADELMKVCDEDSAEFFQKTVLPRIKRRVEDVKKRMEMWDKYANEDQKKAAER